VACWPLVATSDIDANHRAIAAAIAAPGPERIVLTPECALVGYPGAVRAGWDDVDWCGVGDREDDLCTRARRVGRVVVLGTAGPVPGGIANEAVVGGDLDQVVRYRKRCLTPAESRWFVPGDRPGLCRVDGWRLGLAICFDLRVPGVWRDLAAADVDAVLCVAHMAGPDPDPGTKAIVVPALCAARAAEYATALACANTGATDRWLDSGVWDPRGVRTATGPGVVRAALGRRTSYDPWYAALRQRALDGPPGSP
jgi:predicted amidohydrolase